MARLVILAAVICALLLGTIPTANADAWMRWKDQSIARYMDPIEVVNPDPGAKEGYVWQYGFDYANPGPLLDDSGTSFHNCDLPQRLRLVGGGSGAWMHEGIPIYVRLILNVKNSGTEDWVDFHLRAISGCYVYKYYGTWSQGWDMTIDSNGWDYVMDPYWDPSWGPEYGPVHPGETFGCETWIGVTSPTGDFEIELWPTVPEPGGLLSLGMGAGGLVVSMLRRRRAR